MSLQPPHHHQTVETISLDGPVLPARSLHSGWDLQECLRLPNASTRSASRRGVISVRGPLRRADDLFGAPHRLGVTFPSGNQPLTRLAQGALRPVSVPVCCPATANPARSTDPGGVSFGGLFCGGENPLPRNGFAALGAHACLRLALLIPREQASFECTNFIEATATTSSLWSYGQ
jgi:hypothetical protein